MIRWGKRIGGGKGGRDIAMRSRTVPQKGGSRSGRRESNHGEGEEPTGGLDGPRIPPGDHIEEDM